MTLRTELGGDGDVTYGAGGGGDVTYGTGGDGGRYVWN